MNFAEVLFKNYTPRLRQILRITCSHSETIHSNIQSSCGFFKIIDYIAENVLCLILIIQVN